MTIPSPECSSPFGQECGCSEHNGVCWPVPLTGCCVALVPGPDATPERVALVAQMMRLANEILHAFSGRQFGLCPVTVRPCRDGCGGSSTIVLDYVSGGGLVQPLLDGGQWFNNVCGSCVTDCSCSEVCEVTLPGPVESIVEVLVDGLAVAPATYRLDNHRKLVRVGAACWPTCQDMALPASAVGTFAVTMLRGTPVPEAGRWAAGLLACELIKACTPGEAGCCVLPPNVQSIVREGVSMELAAFGLNADGASEFGRTGIPEVDMWLSAVNPLKAHAPSRAYSVDRPAARSTTWPCND